MKLCPNCPDVDIPPYPLNQVRAEIPVPFLSSAAGAGDLVARLAALVGGRPCEPCRRRQEWLNRLQLTPWRR